MVGRSQSLIIHLLGSISLFIHSSSAACFLPDGTNRNTVGSTNLGDYLPCDATAKVSMCCAIGREKDLDICLPGGFCKHKRTGDHYRESCTDKSWKSSACIKLFVDGPGRSMDADLSLCDNGSWCLGANDTGRQCCQQNRGFFISDGKPTRNDPDITTTSQSAVTTSATSSASSAPSISGSSMSTGTYVGIGIGVGLGVIAIIASGVIVVLQRRRRANQDTGMPGTRRKSLQYSLDYGKSLAPPGTMMPPMEDHGAESVELDSHISTNFQNRQSYLSYRAPGLQDGPAELPCEDHSPVHEKPGLA